MQYTLAALYRITSRFAATVTLYIPVDQRPTAHWEARVSPVDGD
jgi:hypothetical protein